MSFSHFIKINKIIENYRADNSKEEQNFHNKHESIKSSITRPKSMKDKKISTYKFLENKDTFKILNKDNYDDNLLHIYNSNDYNEIYENIIFILNNFIKNNKSYEKLLCQVLRAIYKYIYDFSNNKIKTSYNSTLITNKGSKIFKKSRTSSTSKKLELKNQNFLKNEYDYLMYINELHKKLFKLENELKIKSAKKKSLKENIKLLFDMDPSRYYAYNQLQIRKSSFSIIAKKEEFKTNNLLESKGKKKNNLKIGLKDILDNYERNLNTDIKFYNNKKYLLSHPKLNFNGYMHKNYAKTSSIINERINRIPKEAFGIRLPTKLQSNYKTHLQLSFNQVKFKIEKIRDNKNLDTIKL